MARRMCPLTDDGMDFTCEADHEGVCVDCDFVNRESQRVDVIYVDRHYGTAFRSPDGVGRYFYDTEEEAVDDTFETDPIIVEVDGWDD